MQKWKFQIWLPPVYQIYLIRFQALKHFRVTSYLIAEQVVHNFNSRLVDCNTNFTLFQTQRTEKNMQNIEFHLHVLGAPQRRPKASNLQKGIDLTSVDMSLSVLLGLFYLVVQKWTIWAGKKYIHTSLKKKSLCILLNF